jgi:uncharacterized protein with PIN domain
LSDDDQVTCFRCRMTFVIGEKMTVRTEVLRCPDCKRVFWNADIKQWSADGMHEDTLIRVGVEPR